MFIENEKYYVEYYWKIILRDIGLFLNFLYIYSYIFFGRIFVNFKFLIELKIKFICLCVGIMI